VAPDRVEVKPWHESSIAQPANYLDLEGMRWPLDTEKHLKGSLLFASKIVSSLS